jgi:hypothetical protein
VKHLLRPDDIVYFLHIPKTAGTSFGAIVEQRFMPSDICPFSFVEELNKMRLEDLSQYRLFKGHFGHILVDYLPRPPVIITMLRDPIKRAISDYQQYLRYEQVTLFFGQAQAHFTSQFASLEAYLESDHPWMKAHMSNLQARTLAGHPHNMEWSDDRLFEVAWANLQAITFFGIVEHFQHSLELLQYVLNYPPHTSYEVLNASPTPSDKMQLSTRARERLAELNQVDQRLYDAASQLFETRYHQMVETLLRQHWLQQVSAEDGKNIFFLDGWYNTEFDLEGKTWRWMSKQARLGMKVQGRLVVCLYIKHLIQPDILNCLTVSHNGETLPYEFDGHVLKIHLSGQSDPIAIVQLTMPCAVSPEILGMNNDTRLLSFSVKKVLLQTE